jgi:hypothetical protein
MPVPRFVLLSRPVVDASGAAFGVDVTWTLVSPNARALGRAPEWFADLDTCRAAILAVVAGTARLKAGLSVLGNQWQWRMELDGLVVAVSSRAYLRQHECDYNIRRFLNALPIAETAASVRNVRNRSAWRIGTPS